MFHLLKGRSSSSVQETENMASDSPSPLLSPGSGNWIIFCFTFGEREGITPGSGPQPSWQPEALCSEARSN